ncbi:uncharacterized protein At3g06530-like [Papaver somniferum]|uniref:uncharacterized protein At3g06530-like n=1 Tax=Papaver somniferum TaxID=3469 RepID=UPI000E6F8FA4|nr:uncharacterized protein At3g06530-like [Papaver somniferum]
MPAKKYQPSSAVISFFTAVVVEVLGALKVIDTDTVRNVIPFVLNGVDLNANGGSNQKSQIQMFPKKAMESLNEIRC